jgi:DNA-binding PadR family transcriptional regulator
MSLKFGILGLLAEQPLHGYEVKNRFEAMLGGTSEINIGQVYSTLQRLERGGLAEPADDRGERGKLPYRLTSNGRTALDDWLRESEAGPEPLRQDFYIKVLVTSRLAKGNLDSLLAQQRQAYLRRLRDLAELERGARERGREDLVPVLQGAVLHTEADLKWIDVFEEEIYEKKKGDPP